MFALIHMFHPQKRPSPGLSSKAIIAENVKLGRDVSVCAYAVIKDGSVVGDNTAICEGTFIGSGCIIGSNTYIHPNVSIHDHSVIGDHTIIHSGAVIGGDGFAYFQDEGRIVKVPQIGNVKNRKPRRDWIQRHDRQGCLQFNRDRGSRQDR